MSGFYAGWLELREPADQAARDPALVAALADYLALLPSPALLDIGCGTGSTWRNVSPVLPGSTRWHLLDHDVALLDQARRSIGPSELVTIDRFDLTRLDDLPLDGMSVLSASALFDLCSASFCDRLVERLAAAKVGFYAALTYDGLTDWTIPHALDAEVVADFNRHQTGDKGFGPALGPGATDHLQGALAAHGYRTSVQPSPWRLQNDQRALQHAFLEGFERPLAEIGRLGSGDVLAWLAFRKDAVDTPGSLCRVGHRDLLALPG
ncbi:methyltransferase type 11 [Rhizobium sp. YIM 134829]|uniref:methyltransferase type 11 n=1 Tax=Rhizobium sp. YIM 134829 TaxID=3390453 RepID=UPI00397DFBB0